MENSAVKLIDLVVLQQKDIHIDQLRKHSHEIPDAVTEKNNELAQSRAEIEDAKKLLTQYQLSRKEKEIELGIKENDIRKHSSELNAVKTNEAYRALMSEIDKAKQAKTIFEDEILQLMEQIDQQSAKIKASENEFKQKEASIRAEISAIESELKKFDEDAARYQIERDEFVKQIDPAILQQYEYIRSARGGLAIVPIEDGNCGGCHLTLRPQTINEVSKVQGIVFCDNCARILFKKEEISEPL